MCVRLRSVACRRGCGVSATWARRGNRLGYAEAWPSRLATRGVALAPSVLRGSGTRALWSELVVPGPLRGRARCARIVLFGVGRRRTTRENRAGWSTPGGRGCPSLLTSTRFWSEPGSLSPPPVAPLGSGGSRGGRASVGPDAKVKPGETGSPAARQPPNRRPRPTEPERPASDGARAATERGGGASGVGE